MTDRTSHAFRAAQRSPRSLALYGVIAAFVCALPLVPGMRAMLGLSPLQLARWAGACLLTTALATTLYYRLGERSKVYRAVALAEGVALQVGLVVTVVTSRQGANLLWLVYVAYATLNAGITEARRVLGALVMLPPLFAAGAFLAIHHDPAGALACVLAFAIVTLVFLTSSRAHLQREAAIAAFAEAQTELTALRLRDERLRIARDLHDGPAADLAAIAWKAQALRVVLDDAGEHHERIDALVTRATEGIDELRSVVWALRTPSQPWNELVAYVRQRCHELCEGRLELVVVGDDARASARDRGERREHDPSGEHGDHGEQANPDVPGPLATEVLRLVQEAVRNAVRHAQATRIEVRLTPGSRGGPLVLVVEDDGVGVPAEAIARSRGGLANFRARAKACGGAAEIEARGGGERGTRLRVELAHPPADEPNAADARG